MLWGTEQRIYAEFREDSPLDNAVYLSDTAQAYLYTEEKDGAVATVDGDDSCSTVRQILVDAVREDSGRAEQVRSALQEEKIGLEIRDEEAASYMEQTGVSSYREVEGVSILSQEVMEHEYLSANCNHCGEEVEVLKAMPDGDTPDIYQYNCEDCGNSGHYFGGEPVEEGAVQIWTEFHGKDDLYREIDLREGAHIAIVDLSGRDDSEDQGDEIYRMELGADWVTRPDGFFQRLLDQPIGITPEIRDVIDEQQEKPAFGAVVYDPTGGSDIAYGEDDVYAKVIDTASVHFEGLQ